MSDILTKQKLFHFKQTEKPRVLLICNDEGSATWYKTFFADHGCEPTNAWTPEHGIELFRNYAAHGRPFNLVCMDFVLPGMSGITLARHLNLIYPEAILHLLPSKYFYETPVLSDFLDFGEFPLNPSASFSDLTKLIRVVYEKNQGVRG